MDDASPWRLYGELAPWWPLISPVEDYAEEAGFVTHLLARLGVGDGGELLELGSGGGHMAWYLRRHFDLTLVDRSPAMLEVSRALNPACRHLEGDMRTLRLGRSYHAVFVHDAIDHLTTRADLDRAMSTAFAHTRPGGVAVFVPDHTRETFEPSTDHDGHDHPDGRAVRYLEWARDADPTDTEVEIDYVFVLREPGRPTQVVHDHHRCGLFDRSTWLAAVAGAGFEASSVPEETTEDRTPRELFVGRRSAAPGPQ